MLIVVGTVVDGEDARIVGTFSVPMRTRPSVTGVDLRLMTGATLHNTTTTVQGNVSSIYALTLLIDNASSMTAAECAHLLIKGNGNFFIDAEF